ncbi:hypothetical protein BJ165DRAFT_1529554 [Panaeolus papilionaceus]|nr:hypothetical protein BJ165DRAFT_1529554 [Panaeolus papilionaceus]
MLKRQRPASPPPIPTFSETPFITDPVDLGLIERHHKKRRTLPPSLDGSSRGWAKPHEHHLARFDDDDEEYYESDEDEFEQNRDALSRGNPEFIPSQQAHYASPYKSTNQLLRELHTVNQHRLLFASPVQNLGLSSYLAASGSGLQHQFGNALLQNQSYLYQQQQQPLLQPLQFDNASSHQPSNSPSGGMLSPRRQEWHRSVDSKEDGVISEEVSRVTERYENTNRLLGSLFLSRRKQLEPLDAGHLPPSS